MTCLKNVPKLRGPILQPGAAAAGWYNEGRAQQHQARNDLVESVSYVLLFGSVEEAGERG